jgi:DNA/RNA endonuclease G (NUC1)
VFDLDETLVRVSREEPKYPYDTRINVVDQATQSNYFVSPVSLTHGVDLCEAAAVPLQVP